MFLDCPAYLDDEGAVRCGLPAEVRCRFIMRSTDGPLESAMIGCPVGHVFNAPIEFLTWEKRESKRTPGSAAVRDVPESAPTVSRRNTSPAFYLGRPAELWITVLRARRGRLLTGHLMEAVTSGNRHEAEAECLRRSAA